MKAKNVGRVPLPFQPGELGQLSGSVNLLRRLVTVPVVHIGDVTTVPRRGADFSAKAQSQVD